MKKKFIQRNGWRLEVASFFDPLTGKRTYVGQLFDPLDASGFPVHETDETSSRVKAMRWAKEIAYEVRP